MSIEKEVLDQLVQRAQSTDAEERNAVRQQIMKLPDEALMQLLGSHSYSP